MAVALRDFTSYDAREIEKLVLCFWEENQVPQRLSEKRKGAKKFFLLDGSPYVNGQTNTLFGQRWAKKRECC